MLYPQASTNVSYKLELLNSCFKRKNYPMQVTPSGRNPVPSGVDESEFIMQVKYSGSAVLLMHRT